MKIPHNKPTILSEEIQEVVKSMSNLRLVLGNYVEKFEKSFSDYISLNSAAVNSGTSALHLTLEILGIQAGDKIILPSFTCVTVLLPVLYQKCTPVLVEINKDYNISFEDIKRKFDENTKAIIVPHMFGHPADIEPIKDFCEEKGIYLIEDCAQSLGATYNSKKVGTFGDVSIFSFYATKMITSIQGGMVCSKNREWIKEIKELREPEGDPNDDRVRYRYTMSDINAAVGIEQLKKLDKFIRRRREIASIYMEEFENTELILPKEEHGRKHVYHRFVVRADWNPESIIKKLYKMGIVAARMHYPPLHRRKLLRNYRKGEYPVTDEIAETSVSLPMYPSLSDEEVVYIANSLKKVLKGL